MSDEAINFSAATRVQREAAIINFLEPWRETDSGRVGVGSLVDGNDCYLLATGALGTINNDVSGSDALPLKSHCAFQDAIVTADGVAAFTHIYILPVAVLGADGVTADVPFVLGDRLEIRFEIGSGGGGFTIHFRNEDISGTTLFTRTGTAGAQKYLLLFRFDGAAWVLWDWKEIAAP